MRRRQEMRKFMLLGALVAVVVAALALPALAQNRDLDRDLEGQGVAQHEAFEAFLADYFKDLDGLDNQWWENGRDNDDDNNRDNPWWGDERNEHDWWNDWRHDDDDRDDDRDNDRNNDEVVPAVSQSFQQQAQSGDVNQSFNVSNSGDNSNQCAGIQGVANTGNAQNQVGVIQYGSEADDIELEDSGASITVSPNSFTSCEQQVNQAATASGW
jgi:hypothetical protein